VDVAKDVIRLEQIRKTYGAGDARVEVLKGVSLDIKYGEMIALMGTSGSGKTTLMNILGCLDRPDSGDYFLDGELLSTFSSDRLAAIRSHKIGFVFQSFNLLARTSAIDNVLLPLEYGQHDLSAVDALQRATKLLERVGLADRIHHEPSEMSGGQQQRVAIARSLINCPTLLLADEPTGNLDTKTTAEILALFQQLNREESLTIILVTHDENVANHAQRAIRMRDGVIVPRLEESKS